MVQRAGGMRGARGGDTPRDRCATLGEEHKMDGSYRAVLVLFV